MDSLKDNVDTLTDDEIVVILKNLDLSEFTELLENCDDNRVRKIIKKDPYLSNIKKEYYKVKKEINDIPSLVEFNIRNRVRGPGITTQGLLNKKLEHACRSGGNKGRGVIISKEIRDKFKEEDLLKIKLYLLFGAEITPHAMYNSVARDDDDMEIFKFLHSKGGEIHPDTLHIAFYHNEGLAKYIVESGLIDIKKESESLINSFIDACCTNNLKLVKYLIEKGIDVNISSRALTVAVAYDHRELVEYLLNNGANINIKNEHGTPLMFAIRNRLYEMITYLESKGAVC